MIVKPISSSPYAISETQHASEERAREREEQKKNTQTSSQAKTATESEAIAPLPEETLPVEGAALVPSETIVKWLAVPEVPDKESVKFVERESKGNQKKQRLNKTY